jgi:hypothetical protein
MAIFLQESDLRTLTFNWMISLNRFLVLDNSFLLHVFFPLSAHFLDEIAISTSNSLQAASAFAVGSTRNFTSLMPCIVGMMDGSL